MYSDAELDRMSRSELLRAQKEARALWRQMRFFQGMVIAWGTSTRHILDMIQQGTVPAEQIAIWRDMADKGRLTVRKTQNDINNIDRYLRALETRLGDGTKWYTAMEIAAFLNEGDEHEFRGEDPTETPGL